jgi:PAS domain-containing protein
VGVSSDVTERKRMEQALAAALEREQAASQRATELLALLDALVSTAPAGIVFLDRDLRYVRINQELADMNGVPVEAHIRADNT